MEKLLKIHLVFQLVFLKMVLLSLLEHPETMAMEVTVVIREFIKLI